MKATLCLMLLVLCLGCNPNPGEKSKQQPPSILLIVADDLGYTDLGSFGSDIATPYLDRLASSGVTFSRFHTAPFCAVTRAMLLSGNDNHIAGMGSQDLRTGVFGYEGQLTERIVPLPTLLKEAGYHTYMAGKWHLGTWQEANPANKGFDRSFALLNGAGSHYTDVGFNPRRPVSPYTENGMKTEWPKGSYSTDFYTDKLISYMMKIGTRVSLSLPVWPIPHLTGPCK